MKQAKENYVANARGFFYLGNIFETQMRLWNQYIAGAFLAGKKAGVAPEKQNELITALQKERDALLNKYSKAHSLLLNAAPSNRALQLAKRAEDVDNGLRERYHLDGPMPTQAVTRSQLEEADKVVEEIYAEIKSLSALSPEQVQGEYDAFPEDKMLP